MKIRVLFLFVLVSVFSCKAAKERRQCLELVNGKMVFDISSFEEFKTYISESINYEKVFWVVDGRVSSKELILKLLERTIIINIRNIKGVNANGLDGEDNGVLLITTNKCLENIK
ncbi:hypothetical protein [uncultured Lacinutrix sp.]|uniref:hypothetical protein n=1 Tax=uncultured Lacinutrix sp. TaxID=574032 RepID=UPI0026151C6D|nr:hypothetical protein [uncultured Lacinutrix sp.]